MTFWSLDVYALTGDLRGQTSQTPRSWKKYSHCGFRGLGWQGAFLLVSWTSPFALTCLFKLKDLASGFIFKADPTLFCEDDITRVHGLELWSHFVDSVFCFCKLLRRWTYSSCSKYVTLLDLGGKLNHATCLPLCPDFGSTMDFLLGNRRKGLRCSLNGDMMWAQRIDFALTWEGGEYLWSTARRPQSLCRTSCRAEAGK